MLVPDGPNTLLVRVGADLLAVPDWVPAGQDSEKDRFLPGIWDDVEIVSSGTPRIVLVKAEPDLDAAELRVITHLVSDLDVASTVALTSEVGAVRAASDVDLAPGEARAVEQRVAVPEPHLWSPEDPYLYVLRTTVLRSGRRTDALQTRFGMRTVDWRGGPEFSGRFHLNGRPTYLRGSNITLHRFFEDAWLWINRDGTPTTLTRSVWRDLLGPGPHTPEEYREAYAYLTAGMTGFWRTGRGYAGVLHFTYLGDSSPSGETSDNFLDVAGLELEPRWAAYAREAFAPVGVYIDSWAEALPAGETVVVPVRAVNDVDAPQPATLEVLTVTPDGAVATRSEPVAVELEALGARKWEVPVDLPATDRYLLVARLAPDAPDLPVVHSRRKIGFDHPGQPGPPLPPLPLPPPPPPRDP